MRKIGEPASIRAMSLAPRALGLSVGIGGLTAMVQLPTAIELLGSGVLPGFITAILLLALPAYLAELTSWRLHGGSLLVTMFDGMRAGRVRLSWAICGVALVLVLGMLVTLASFAAGIVGQVGTALVTGTTQELALRYQWLNPVNIVYWLMLAGLLALPACRLAQSRLLHRIGQLLLSILFLGVVIPGLSWFISGVHVVAAESTSWDRGFLRGLSMGAMASLMGLGVMHTAIGRYADDKPDLSDSREIGLVLLTSLALLVWVLALLGWGGWVRAQGTAPIGGLGFFLRTVPNAEIPLALKIMLCLGSVVVLLRASTLVLDVLVVWLTSRFPRLRLITTVVMVAGVALLTALLDIAIDESIDAREQMPLVRVIPVFASTLLPLVALIMMSMFTRSLPPGPMLWAQRLPLPVAAAVYFYWRYPLRLFLLILLLHSSGIGQFLVDFWIPDTHA